MGVMNVLDALLGSSDTDDSEPVTDGGVTANGAGATAGPRARCRNCGRYYGADAAACPDCGSGNKLLGGPAGGTHRRR